MAKSGDEHSPQWSQRNAEQIEQQKERDKPEEEREQSQAGTWQAGCGRGMRLSIMEHPEIQESRDQRSRVPTGRYQGDEPHALRYRTPDCARGSRTIQGRAESTPSHSNHSYAPSQRLF